MPVSARGLSSWLRWSASHVAYARLRQTIELQVNDDVRHQTAGTVLLPKHGGGLAIDKLVCRREKVIVHRHAEEELKWRVSGHVDQGRQRRSVRRHTVNIDVGLASLLPS